MTTALLVVDAQNDFMPGGALAVPEGDQIIPAINVAIINFNQIIWTRDWHPEDHCSFEDNGGTWPVHCVAETPGAQINGKLPVSKKHHIWDKATSSKADAYSPFQNENGKKSGFVKFLNGLKVKELYICGLATEYCVKATVLDALKAGFKVVVITDAIHGIAPQDTKDALKEMIDAGASFIDAKDIHNKK